MGKEYFKRVLDELEEGVSIIDPDFRIEWVNKALRNKGFDIDLIKGHKCHQVYKQDHKVCKGCPSLSVFRTGKTITITEKGADSKDYEVTAIPIKEEGKVVKVVEIVKEIAKEKENYISVEAHKRAERKCQAFVEDAEDLIFRVDKDLKILSLNKKAGKALGKRLKEVIGKRISELFPANITEEYAKSLQKVFRTKESSIYESESVFNGRKAWLATTLNPIKDDEGNIESVMGISRDITKSKDAENLLRYSNTLIKKITEHASDLIFSKDNDLRYTFVNKAFEDLVGLKSDMILGKRPEEIFSPAVAKSMKKADVDSLSGNIHDHVYYLHINSKDVYLHTIQSPIIGADGKIEGIAGVVRDITKTKRVESDLKVALKKYHALFESANDVVAILDERGNIISINDKVTEVSGYRKSELLGRNLRSLEMFTKQSIHLILSNFKKRIMGRKVKPYYVEIIHKKGSSHFLEVSAKRVILDEKIPIDLAILRDITERKKAEKAMRDSEVRFRELFNSMSSGVAVYESKNNGRDFIFKDFNKTAEKIDKIKKKDIIGKNVVDIFPNIQKFSLLSTFKSVYKTGKPMHHPPSLYKDNRISGWRENYVYKLPGREIVAVYDDITDRKMAEESLLESEEKYHSVVDGTNDLIVIHQDGIIRFINSSAKKFTGYSPDNVIRRRISEFIHPDDRKMVLERYMKRKQGKKVPKIYQIRIIKKDGTELPVEINTSLIKYAGRTSALVFLRDISRRREAEESMIKYLRGFETSPNSMMLVEYMKGRPVIRKINQSFTRLYGYSEKDAIGRNPKILRSGRQDKEYYNRMWGSLLNPKKGSWNDEIVNRKNDGKSVNVILSVSTLFNDKGKATHFIANHVDITERMRAEKAIKDSERRFRMLFESAPDSFYLSDLKGNFIDGNKAAQELTGYSKENLMGKSFLKMNLLPKEEFIKASKLLARNAAGYPAGPGEFILVKKDGSRIIAEISTTPLKISNKNVVLCIIRDITARKKAEKDLKNAYEDLKKRKEELEKFQRVAIRRELRMVELKKRIKDMESGLK